MKSGEYRFIGTRGLSFHERRSFDKVKKPIASCGLVFQTFGMKFPATGEQRINGQDLSFRNLDSSSQKSCVDMAVWSIG